MWCILSNERIAELLLRYQLGEQCTLNRTDEGKNCSQLFTVKPIQQYKLNEEINQSTSHSHMTKLGRREVLLAQDECSIVLIAIVLFLRHLLTMQLMDMTALDLEKSLVC